MNRVYCLYRVSTLGQVEKDDIPMQRVACQEFAARQGWDIIREFSEKGISGYKVSSEKRDAIQQIKAAAEKGKFDILLVFMFDRLGRKDDETPFVVQWFSEKGIHIWSVTEGEARFDSHVDKLMNYIRFWQASGESLKTSERTKTRLAQLTEEGIFTGGTCPFGYELFHNGRINKKGVPCMDIRSNDDEAETVRLIFRKTVDEGYGSYRLACYLNRCGIRTRRGGDWLAQSVYHILTREMYLGYLINGDARSKHIPELQIIDDQTFSEAQRIVTERRVNNPIQRHVPLTTISHTLLSGILYCGTCGAKLTVTTQNKYYKLADGTEKKKQTLKYCCYQRTKKYNYCNGQTVYNVSAVDNAVTGILHQLFSKIHNVQLDTAIKSKHDAQNNQLVAKQRNLKSELSKATVALRVLESEILKVIQGQSEFDAATLNKLISEHKTMILSLEYDLQQATQLLEDKQDALCELSNEFKKISDWADVFDMASMPAKKMIAANLLNKVIISRGYAIEVEFNISLEQFKLGLSSAKAVAAMV